MAESVSCFKKRVCLPLKKRTEVLQEAKRHPKVTIRELTQLFQCRETEVTSVLKNKEKLWSKFESNSSSSTSKRSRSCKFSDVNSALYLHGILSLALRMYAHGGRSSNVGAS